MQVITVKDKVVGFGDTISIGVQHENAVETIAFKGIPTFGVGQVVTLGWVVENMDDHPADEVTLALEDGLYVYTVSNEITQYGGANLSSYIQVEYGGKVWSTKKFYMHVDPLPDVDGTVEQYEPSIITRLSKLSDEVLPITKKDISASHYFKVDADLDTITPTLVKRIMLDGFTHINLCPLLVNNDALDNNNLSYQYTLAKLEDAVQCIVENGLAVSIKMHLVKASDGHGLGDPTDADALLDDLKSCILDSLSVSQSFKIICLANESKTICAGNREKWEEIIASIRAQNPTIKITNSALYEENHDDTCVFWDLCDYVGCNLYASAVDYNVVGTYSDALKAMFISHHGGATYVSTLYKRAAQYNKPYMITEFGIRPYAFQMASPSSWSALGDYNETVQSEYLKAVLDVFLNAENCAGVSVWNITDGFTILDRAAENSIKTAIQEARK